MSITQPEEKYMYIDESKLAAYRNTIRDHKRSLLEADWQATSVERKGGMNLEMEQVAAQVDESIFLFTYQIPDGSWMAGDGTYDGAPDSSSIVGHGATEAEAVEDYKAQKETA